MSERHPLKKDMCDTYQKKIMMKIKDKSALESDISLNNHINGCPDCQHFVKSLQFVQGQMQRSPLKNLKPRSQILKNIINTLRLKQEFKRNEKE